MRNKAKNQSQRFHRRRPRTAQERRANCRYGDNWGRAKRNWLNLVSDWNDEHCCVQKTWKVRRRHQYHECPRGEQHEIFLGAGEWFYKVWNLEQWFINHDIPYQIEPIKQTEKRIVTHWQKWTCLRYEPHEYVRVVRPRKNGAKKTKTTYVTEISWRGVYGYVEVEYDTPRERTYTTLSGYRLVWWSDKDIGIDYILKRS